MTPLNKLIRKAEDGLLPKLSWLFYSASLSMDSGTEPSDQVVNGFILISHDVEQQLKEIIDQMKP